MLTGLEGRRILKLSQLMALELKAQMCVVQTYQALGKLQDDGSSAQRQRSQGEPL